jgi:hypothetical protein
MRELVIAIFAAICDAFVETARKGATSAALSLGQSHGVGVKLLRMWNCLARGQRQQRCKPGIDAHFSYARLLRAWLAVNAETRVPTRRPPHDPNLLDPALWNGLAMKAERSVTAAVNPIRFDMQTLIEDE